MSKDKNLKLKDKLPALTVYCGASSGLKPIYLETAEALGKLFAEEGIHLVYGGGDKGLMGKVSSTVIENGGTATGIIPDFMIELEWVNKDLDDLKVVKTMSERKNLLLNLAEGIVMLPGGIGTMEEFFEALSWSQLLIHEKPIGILNIDGYYDNLLELIHGLQKEGFVDTKTSDLYVVDSDPRKLLEKMAEWNHHDTIKELTNIEDIEEE